MTISKVETKIGLVDGFSATPYLVVDSFPKLGMITALRFLEWVIENPHGVVSLPTGKTPEYFIKWTQIILANWERDDIKAIRKEYGISRKPYLNQLRFVQIDEFYPISSSQRNSFFSYISNFYIKGFGLNPDNALLINCNEIPLAGGKNFDEVFQNGIVDLSLRFRHPKNQIETLQQTSIFMIDDWCRRYEKTIREWGGIGFFLGGIGPDGHIAFNTRGSDHESTTRLTQTNFETQAVSAGDLGGISISSNRLVITIGLGTITYNPDLVAIIFAASEAKAQTIKEAIESEPNVLYPATALQKLPNSRFYLTKGASVKLNSYLSDYYQGYCDEKIERAIINCCSEIEKYGDKLELSDLKSNIYCKTIPDLSLNTVQNVISSIKRKIMEGTKREENQRFLHTGPHHDDIMLGLMPHINRHLRSESNEAHFAILTSGFTAVTNSYIVEMLEFTKYLLSIGKIEMVKYLNFFDSGYKIKWIKDIHHYLDKVADRNKEQMRRGLSHRLVRIVTDIYKVKNEDELVNKIDKLIDKLNNSYDGEKNPFDIQILKGMIREFEEELVWAHFGVRPDFIHHLQLGFYTGDIFTDQPEIQRDVEPIVNLILKINPTVISLAMDPEGSGPDTHYKVLQAIAESLRILKENHDLTKLRIWGYRNVWYRFHPAEVNRIVPVSLNSLAVLREAFKACYWSQVDAPFPSYELNGKFSELTQRIWVEQLKQIQLLLGKDFFYQHYHPLIRATHGLVYFKEMNVQEFLTHARELKMKAEESLLKNLNSL